MWSSMLTLWIRTLHNFHSYLCSNVLSLTYLALGFRKNIWTEWVALHWCIMFDKTHDSFLGGYYACTRLVSSFVDDSATCILHNCQVINPLKPTLVWIIFTDSVRTSKRTPHFTIRKISWLTLFKQIITVYTKNYTKPINKKCRLSYC
jgi:hypothetical protein